MKPDIIVMLTYNDKTVENALEIFNTCSNLPVQKWGFKNIGLPSEAMLELLNSMKSAGKTTFLEVVTYTQEECMKGAHLAVDFGFDYLMGTIFYESVWDFLKGEKINYFPFVGKVHGGPSVLEGTTASMLDQSSHFHDIGVHGIDLLAFRHVNDPEQLAINFVRGSKIPVVIAGSINSLERLQIVGAINPWGFTMGSALFNKLFVPDGSFRENLLRVLQLMDAIA